jgi:hypothetical protein
MHTLGRQKNRYSGFSGAVIERSNEVDCRPESNRTEAAGTAREILLK